MRRLSGVLDSVSSRGFIIQFFSSLGARRETIWLKRRRLCHFSLKRTVLQTSHLGYFGEAQQRGPGRNEVAAQGGAGCMRSSSVCTQVLLNGLAGAIFSSKCVRPHVGMGLESPRSRPASTLTLPSILGKSYIPRFLLSKMRRLEQTSFKVSFSLFQL